jgi:hypothetical protein
MAPTQAPPAAPAALYDTKEEKEMPSSFSSPFLLLFSIALCAVVLVMLCLGKKKKKTTTTKRQQQQQQQQRRGESLSISTSAFGSPLGAGGGAKGLSMQGVNSSYVPLGMPVDVAALRPLEFKREDLTLSRDMGDGLFGNVLEGEVSCA